uniref:RRM domain-containing protein n=1 Tax=Ditylenchus dipsaci TaxID=166011 RepID=A0A915ETH0_9BILA
MSSSPFAVRIDNLDNSVTEDDLRSSFQKFGEIDDISYQKGHAIVMFHSASDGHACIEQMDNQTSMDKTSVSVLFNPTIEVEN